jgi:hypothetical protein
LHRDDKLQNNDKLQNRKDRWKNESTLQTNILQLNFDARPGMGGQKRGPRKFAYAAGRVL